jgi:hypothetical protein
MFVVSPSKRSSKKKVMKRLAEIRGVAVMLALGDYVAKL